MTANIRWTVAVAFALVVLVPLVPIATAEGHVCGGVFEAAYDAPATVGYPQAAWVPHDLGIDGGHLAGLDSLTVTLSWTNRATGGADFGIGVGGEGGFRYWNQEYQTSLGDHTERRTWDRDAIRSEGWHEREALAVGPSVSTGQFAADAIPYRLEWQATYRIEGSAPCLVGTGETDSAGAPPADIPEDGQRDSPGMDAEPTEERLPRILLPILLAGVGLIGLLAMAQAARSSGTPPDQPGARKGPGGPDQKER